MQRFLGFLAAVVFLGLAWQPAHAQYAPYANNGYAGYPGTSYQSPSYPGTPVNPYYQNAYYQQPYWPAAYMRPVAYNPVPGTGPGYLPLPSAQPQAMAPQQPASEPTLPPPTGSEQPRADAEAKPQAVAAPQFDPSQMVACNQGACCQPVCPPPPPQVCYVMVQPPPQQPVCPPPCCDKEPCFVPEIFFGFDAFHGISDFFLNDNMGMRGGINVGMALIDSWGIGIQAGASYGGYDWDGRLVNENSSWQSQGFATAGIFKRCDKGLPFNAAVVYDYMFNDAFGVLANEPELTQLRGMFSIPLTKSNEIGVWGTLRDGGTSQAGITFLPVNQYNAFWRFWFCGGGEVTIYGGMTDNTRHHLGAGSLGTWIAGAGFRAPLNDHFAVYGDFAYMRPSSDVGGGATFENAYNISMGVAFYPCACLRKRSNCCRGWLPMLPVANNGSFLVDTNLLTTTN